jgi:hypothetical protein
VGGVAARRLGLQEAALVASRRGDGRLAVRWVGVGAWLAAGGQTKEIRGMSVREIGKKLVDMCRQGKNLEAIHTMYDDGVVSVEAASPPDGSPREMKGKQAVVGKGTWWQENHEVHSASVRGPFPHGEDRFAVVFDFDVTNKPSGRRMKLEEVAVYQVKNGKIVREEFYYDMG